jgi:hypothetical protein
MDFINTSALLKRYNTEVKVVENNSLLELNLEDAKSKIIDFIKKQTADLNNREL